MVESVSSSGLGLFGSSANRLGGDPRLGAGGDQVYVNAATGNLIVQSQDERLCARGFAWSPLYTDTSHRQLDDDNGDNGRLAPHERVYAQNGNTVHKVVGDGRDLLYTYNTARARYESSDGDGAHDFL